MPATSLKDHQPLDLQSLLNLATDFKNLFVAADSSNATPSPTYDQISAAANELANRVQQYAEYRELRDEADIKEFEPTTVASNVCEIKIELDTSTAAQEKQIFNVTGTVFARTYIQPILFMRSAEVEISADAEFDISSFDTMIDLVAQIVPTLTKNPLSTERMRQAEEILAEIRQSAPSILEDENADKLLTYD